MAHDRKTRIGLVTDIHYDGNAQAMNRLYEAVVSLNAGGVDAMVVMGDMVNGSSESNARRLLREVAALCDAFHGQVWYMPGNHDLDYLTKEQFYNHLGRAGDPAHFHFELGGYGFIGIDCNHSPDGTPYKPGNFDWEQAALPEKEMEWLRARLAASLLPVVVVSHQRIDKETRFAIRNHAEVRELLDLSGKVRAVFQGHNHQDDLVMHRGTAFYTLGAHADGAGPAVLQLDARGGVRLLRDFRPMEDPVA